jgi:hypothetical protein
MGIVLSAIPSLHGATLTVTSLADSGPGSLRDLVAASSTGDTIQFAVVGTIGLNSAININHTLYVLGPGPATLAVDANHVDRAFVASGNPVYLSDVAIAHGLVHGTPGADGALFQNGQPGGNAYGGAILDNTSSDSLILSNCWFADNIVQGGKGGRGGDNTLTAGFRPGDGALGGDALGGAVYAAGSVTIVNCAFSANRALAGAGGAGGNDVSPTPIPNMSGGTGGNGGAARGGAVYEDAAANLVFFTSTFSGNRINGGPGGNGGNSGGNPGGFGGNGGEATGGGIRTFIAAFRSCTVLSNSAFGGTGGSGGNGLPTGANGTSTGGMGGGVFGYTFACICQIGNTILADNFADGSYLNFFLSLSDRGYNFIGSDDFPACPWSSSTQVGTVQTPLHPLLGPVAQNGGGLPTHATTLASPVTDAGTNFGFVTDQRGAPRPYDFSSILNPTGGDGTDIGAYELGSPDLGLNVISNNAVISWPAWYGDFLLQSSTNLNGSNIWSGVLDTPLLVGNQFVITNRITETFRLYRLVNQQ